MSLPGVTVGDPALVIERSVSADAFATVVSTLSSAPPLPDETEAVFVSVVPLGVVGFTWTRTENVWPGPGASVPGASRVQTIFPVAPTAGMVGHVHPIGGG